jgi:transcriptional regulator with XRE-family HTH domain
MEVVRLDVKVERLQKHLSLIRTCAGWSASELGKKLGVSRQMVSNLENGRNKMTMMQYLAIRQVLDQEIARSSQSDDTQMLRDVIRVLVDEYDSFTDEQRTQVLADANLLAPSIVSKKTTRKNASLKWVTVLAGVVVATVAVGTKLMLKDKD